MLLVLVVVVIKRRWRGKRWGKEIKWFGEPEVKTSEKTMIRSAMFLKARSMNDSIRFKISKSFWVNHGAALQHQKGSLAVLVTLFETLWVKFSTIKRNEQTMFGKPSFHESKSSVNRNCFYHQLFSDEEIYEVSCSRHMKERSIIKLITS